MLHISLPNNHLPERTYIIDTFFNEWLDVPVTTDTENQRFRSSIRLPNGNLIHFHDHFFSNFWKEQAYLTEAKIPEKTVVVDSPLQSNQKLALIYGTDFFEKKTQADGTIHYDCGFDIFASAFFLLARWEESLNPVLDAHERFPDEAAFLIKNQLHHRPLVNEYLVFLIHLLNEAGFPIQPKFKFETYVTHDVDDIRRFKQVRDYFNALGGDLLKRKNPFLWFTTSADYLFTLSGFKKDPFDTFEALMEASSKRGLISRFYLMPGFNGEQDVRYDIREPHIKELIQQIKAQGHQIGIHPGYRTFQKPDLLKEEINRLQEIAETDITEGRQHYLRFSVPHTWRNWADTGLKKSMNLGYHAHAGFRCGTCFPFQPFDFVRRERIELTEVPLILMEFGLLRETQSPKLFREKALQLVETVKLYGGTFNLLWHNNNFNQPLWSPYARIYDEILEAMIE